MKEDKVNSETRRTILRGAVIAAVLGVSERAVAQNSPIPPPPREMRRELPFLSAESLKASFSNPRNSRQMGSILARNPAQFLETNFRLTSIQREQFAKLSPHAVKQMSRLGEVLVEGGSINEVRFHGSDTNPNGSPQGKTRRVTVGVSYGDWGAEVGFDF